MGQRGRPTAQIVLSDDERETLQRWARRPKTGQALALRCRIVLDAASGSMMCCAWRLRSCFMTRPVRTTSRLCEPAWV